LYTVFMGAMGRRLISSEGNSLWIFTVRRMRPSNDKTVYFSQQVGVALL
jgi:hypothetical protein